MSTPSSSNLGTPPSLFSGVPSEILHAIFMECILAEFLPIQGGIAQEEPFQIAESDWEDGSSTSADESSDAGSGSQTDAITQDELDALNEYDEPLPPGYSFRSGLKYTLFAEAVSPNIITRLEFANARAPWLLGQVCRWWRQILMASSDLWRYIDVDVDDYMFGRYNSSRILLERQFQLSGHQTLHIRFSSCFDTGRVYDLFELLLEHQQRWETVELSIPDFALVPLLGYLDMVVSDTPDFEPARVSDAVLSFPSLKSLVVFNHGEPRDVESRIPFFEIFAQSPNMRTFFLLRPMPMNALPTHWNHLSSLSLHLKKPIFGLTLLQHFSLLEECTFEIDEIPGPPPSVAVNASLTNAQTVSLPLMASFTLRLNRSLSEDFVTLMENINAPNLNIFAYHIFPERTLSEAIAGNQGQMTDTSVHETAILGFLETSGQNLKHIFIDCKLLIHKLSSNLKRKDLFRMVPRLEQATFATQLDQEFLQSPLPPLHILDLYLPQLTASDLFGILEGNEMEGLRGISCHFIIDRSDNISDVDFGIKFRQLREKQLDIDIWEGPRDTIPNLWGITYPSPLSTSNHEVRLLQQYVEHRVIDYSNRPKSFLTPYVPRRQSQIISENLDT